MTAAELRRRRDAMGLSQMRLAVLLGVSIQAVQSWEHGRRPCPPLLTRALNDVEREAAEADDGKIRIADGFYMRLGTGGTSGATTGGAPIRSPQWGGSQTEINRPI